MHACFKKLGLTCIVLTGTAMFAACGGGGISAAADVVTVWKPISSNDSASTRDIALMGDTGIAVLSIRCVDMGPPNNIPGLITVQIQTPGILLDMTASDAQKAKETFVFFPFGPAEEARSKIFAC